MIQKEYKDIMYAIGVEPLRHGQGFNCYGMVYLPGFNNDIVQRILPDDPPYSTREKCIAALDKKIRKHIDKGKK